MVKSLSVYMQYVSPPVCANMLREGVHLCHTT